MNNNTTQVGTDITALKQAIQAGLLGLHKYKQNPNAIFDEDDIERLNGVPKRDNDPDAVPIAINQLIVTRILRSVKFPDGSPGFKLRLKEDADKYKTLDNQQAMVYEQIEDSGGDGIWLKTIRVRLNMHESAVTAAIKHLTAQHLIRDLKNVANTNRKMYIKVGVQQSERSTGGPWYTDGEMDETFVEAVMDKLYYHILLESMQASKAGRHAIDRFEKKKVQIRQTALKHAERDEKRAKNPKRGVKTVSVAEVKAVRDKALGGIKTEQKLEEQEAREDYKRRKSIYEELFPFPAGYKMYPKLDPLTEYILDSGICTDDVVLTATDINLVLDLMVLDKRLEEVDCGDAGVGYKVTRQSLKPLEDAFNVYTEAPCGRCPVFELCEEGGPVGPTNCEYFNEWLSQ